MDAYIDKLRTAASEYEQAHRELIRAEDELRAAQNRVDNCRRTVSTVASSLCEFVGGNIPIRNVLVGEKLVIVKHNPGMTATVLVQDVVL